GAGFLGFAHTLPQVNLWTHGTLVTAMHGHMAFWGAYGMLIFAIICYAMPNLTGRNRMNTAASTFAYWATTIGMVAMTVAFGIAGIAQVYLERKMGMDFMQVQTELEIHFLGLVLAAALFTLGFLAYVYEFIKSGTPLKDISVGDKKYV
ncbi:MAG: nitric-oxide reductase large subunit, partial [Halobacteriovoraceae bacterium]|nr:nitric-oxide reductase large subunit [Halobacteriovoraceae bacterium]